MFLTSITLVANPSSPAEVIRFFTILSVIVLSGGTHCHPPNGSDIKLAKNNHCLTSGDYIIASESAKFSHAGGFKCWL